MESEALLKKTLQTIGVMLGSCILVVGTLTLLVLFVVGRALGPREDAPQGSGVAPAPASTAGGGHEADVPHKNNAKNSGIVSGRSRAI
jgi:hypothetical protein